MDQYLPNKLYINNIHVGNKTLTEALELIEIIESEELRKKISIEYTDSNGIYQAYSFTREHLGYYADKKALIKTLEATLKKKKNILTKIIKYKQKETSERRYVIKFNTNNNKFMKSLMVFDDSKLNPPQDAKYAFNNGKIEIIKEQNGYVFDKKTLYEELLNDSSLQAVRLKTRLEPPKVTSEQLSKQGIKEKISSFTTRFDAGNVPRASNIRLAAKILEGKILAPGDTFSFNEAVGQRTEESGFLEAGVYMNGKIDTGLGGGICQVSTTLYNSVLLADLEVSERHNHSLTVPYVPLSRDAAVSWGLQDFKFINNTDYYIYIHASTTRNSITFDLFSTKSDKKVELISTAFSRVKAPVLYKVDENLEIGKQEIEEPGHDGYESQLTKKVFLSGKLVNTGVVSKDKYQTSPKIIIKGTKLPESIPKYYYRYFE
jgi:vancomycin resistance protein YoaR